MSTVSNKVKTVTLCLRGFELTPKQVESAIGRKSSENGTYGEPVKPGVRSLLKRSFVRFSVQLPDNCRIDELIPALWTHLGGIERVREARDIIKPEFLEVDLVLPIKNSDEQEGGLILPSTIAELGLLRASLSFQFL